MASPTPPSTPSSSLRGQVVAITGAASGIGRATAARLAAGGAFLSLADANASGLDETTATLKARADADGNGARFFARTLDVRDPQATHEWIADTVAFYEGAPLAAAANLAGVFGPSIAQERGTVRNVNGDEFDWVMAVNCRGLFHCLQAELQHMRSGSKGYGGGSIVNGASIAGLVGVEGNGPYAASKHAVIGLTRTAAKEEGARAIRVNAIAPGIIDTPMISGIEKAKGTTDLFGSGDPGALARKGDADEVAGVICYLLGGESSFINGAVLPVDGGWIC